MMSKNKYEEWEELNKFICESFSDGRVECELRLSDFEVDYIKQRYPYSTFEPFSKKQTIKHGLSSV